MSKLKVKKTGGGTFNLADSPINFIAASSTKHKLMGEVVKIDRGCYLVAVNELMDGTTPMQHFREVINSGSRYFLDSGIFNLSMRHANNNNMTMDAALSLHPNQVDGFDELFEKYISIVTEFKDKLWGYVEIDQGGKENKIATRARLENEYGLSPIPVFHPINDGWEYFDYLAARYDRICVGNLVKAPPTLRTKLLYEIDRRRRKFPTLKWIHALGVSPNHHMNTYWFESCDSSSWLGAARWGRAPSFYTLGERYDATPDWFVAPIGMGGEYYYQQEHMGAYRVVMFDRSRKAHHDELKELGLI